MGMGGGGGQTQSTEFRPQPGMQPYINNYLSNLENFANPNNPMWSPLQQQAFGAMPGAANQANAFGQQGQNTATNFMQGGTLPQNDPYFKQFENQQLKQLENQYQTTTVPGITAQAVRSGGLGGSGQNQAEQYGKWQLGQNMADMMSSMGNNAWNTGEQAMLSTLGMAPALQGMPFAGPQALLSAGTQQQKWPMEQLGMLGQGVQGMAGLGRNTNVSLGGGGSFK